jgi:Protein of unknown function (DUF1152)
MLLNIPIFSELANCENLLIAGMGGGFDIFCGLPIYFELKNHNPDQTIHLANLSLSKIAFSEAANLENLTHLSDTLVGVHANTENLGFYFPELYLCQWFQETYHQEIIIWCFKVTGVQTLLKDYRLLIKHLSIDGILLLDGGVDSLVKGNETKIGTVVEDAISLGVMSELKEIKFKVMACVGFGAERDMNYEQIWENIANLMEKEGCLGSCSLLKQMNVYQQYEQAVFYVQNQINQDPSVINSSIISAVQGHYGDYHLTEKTTGSQLEISPLMSIYWFFDIQSVINNNLFLPEIINTQTFIEVMRKIIEFFSKTPRR